MGSLATLFLFGWQDSAARLTRQRPSKIQTAPEATPGPFRRPPSVPGPSLRIGNTSLVTARRQTSPDPVKPPWAWGTKVLDPVIDSARLHQVRADSSRGLSTQDGRNSGQSQGAENHGLPSNYPDATERHPRLHRTSLQPGGTGRCDRVARGRADALQPQVAEAASDPNHVAFTLEGCRLENGDFIEATVTCEDAAYTTGNLGKEWNELDLVPHRLTTSASAARPTRRRRTRSASPPTVRMAARPGTTSSALPVVNDALSRRQLHGQLWARDDHRAGRRRYRQVDRPPDHHQPGQGHDLRHRLVRATRARIAPVPGLSLHTNRTNQAWSTSGIGAADVSIPVNEILPQELSKTMTAEVGQTYTWDDHEVGRPDLAELRRTPASTPRALGARTSRSR